MMPNVSVIRFMIRLKMAEARQYGAGILFMNLSSTGALLNNEV